MFSALRLKDNANDYRTTALRRVRGFSLKQKVVVVTGASGALGKELSFAFYKVGATVIMAGRNMTKLQAAKEEILNRSIPEKEEFGDAAIEGGSLTPMALDLSDYESIQNFVKDLKAKHPKGIYALVNNAGVLPSHSKGFQESKYGLETTFQLNFVSTVVLTELMIPLLEKGGNDATSMPRIVNVSSMSHADAGKPVDFSKIPSTAETFGGYNKDYAESKWLLTTYTVALSKRLSNKILVASADPGVSPDSPMWDEQSPVIKFFARNVFYKLTKTGPQAAATSAKLVVASASDFENGGYYASGNLVDPPMREDTLDPESWNKAEAVLEEFLPNDLKWCAEGAKM